MAAAAKVSSFKLAHPVEHRKQVSERIRHQYPGLIPIIVEKASDSSDIPEVSKTKFLVPENMTVGTFLVEIRKHMPALSPEKTIFLFVNNITVPYTGAKLSQIAKEHQDEDGFLYITYSGENTLGSDGFSVTRSLQ